MSKLTKSDIKRAMLRSFCYQWQSFNYETMQSAGFAQFITPAIKKIYTGRRSSRSRRFWTPFSRTFCPQA